MIKFLKFNPEDACKILGSVDEVNAARINQISGPAYTAVDDDRILGCGGIRVLGVGEVWALYSEEAKAKKKDLLVHTRYWLDRMMREKSLYRLWSECPEPLPNQNFLKHMDFRKLEAYLRG